MNFIRLYKKGESCLIPDGGNYLLVLARDLDANGVWIPTQAQTTRTLPELKTTLGSFMADGGLVVQASGHFGKLAQELGLPLLRAEWGTS